MVRIYPEFQFQVTVKPCLWKHASTPRLSLVFYTRTTITTLSKHCEREGADAIRKRKIKSCLEKWKALWHLLIGGPLLTSEDVNFPPADLMVCDPSEGERAEWPFCFLGAARQCLWNLELGLCYSDRLFINRSVSAFPLLFQRFPEMLPASCMSQAAFEILW